MWTRGISVTATEVVFGADLARLAARCFAFAAAEQISLLGRGFGIGAGLAAAISMSAAISALVRRLRFAFGAGNGAAATGGAMMGTSSGEAAQSNEQSDSVSRPLLSDSVRNESSKLTSG